MQILRAWLPTSKHLRRYRAALRRKGLCVRCTKPSGGKALCAECQQKDSIRAQERRLCEIAQGFAEPGARNKCSRCGDAGHNAQNCLSDLPSAKERRVEHVLRCPLCQLELRGTKNVVRRLAREHRWLVHETYRWRVVFEQVPQ